MDAVKVVVGALLLAASGLAIAVDGRPGTSLPLLLASPAAVGLAAMVLIPEGRLRR